MERYAEIVALPHGRVRIFLDPHHDANVSEEQRHIEREIEQQTLENKE